MRKAQVYAKHNKATIGPKKVRVVMDLIRGMSAHEAERALRFNRTKAGKLILKVLRSAIANARTNHNLNPDNLVITELKADEAPTSKRMRIVAKSRTSPILKRSSHIIVGLSEKEAK